MTAIARARLGEINLMEPPMPGFQTEDMEAVDEAKPDWVDQMAMATQRVMEIAERLKEDQLLIPGSRHLLKIAEGFPSRLSRHILETMAFCLEREDDIENMGKGDWVDEMSAATQRVMVAATALHEDRDLMRGARCLLDVRDGMSADFHSQLFEIVAGWLMVEAAKQQQKARAGRP
jgi:RNA polymerase-binding transcription factor DksA